MSTINDISQSSPDIVEVDTSTDVQVIEADTENKVELIEVSGGLRGSSILQSLQQFMFVSGGSPGDTLVVSNTFDGGNPGTKFTVPPGHKNSIGG